MTSTRPVLVVGPRHDPEARRVRAALRALGVPASLLDTAAFPEERGLTLRDGVPRRNGRTLPEPLAVYVRSIACNPYSPAYAADWKERPEGLMAQTGEKRSMLVSLLDLYARRGIRMANAIRVNGQHGLKPYQLSLLAASDLPVPAWIATNEPDEARQFCACAGEAVYKPLAGGATVRAVGPEDLTDERLDALHAAPVLFQKRIRGLSVRVYVVGDSVAAAGAIHSEELDYRRGEDRVEPIALRPDERQMAITAARACDMRFAGVDLIRGEDGKTWVIESNPSPMFAVFERKTGLDVAGPLAAHLADA